MSKKCKKNKTTKWNPENGFASVLSEKRIPVKAPDQIVDENGKAAFGTFEDEIRDFNFTDIHNQSLLPDFTNKGRLTLWEAVEVNFDEVTLLTAVSVLGGVVGVGLTILYDKAEKKRYTWMSPTPAVKMAENLLNGAVTYAKSPVNSVKVVNDFGNGKAHVSGRGIGFAGSIKYDVALTRISKPSVVSIPFGKNKPLYSQKDLFSVDGSVTWKGKTYRSNEASCAIIDDHRGYYPYNSHYDWVTTMGVNKENGQTEPFGFNLTRNQSENQDDYNENLLWMTGKSSRLTPVKFEHLSFNYWHITDDYGMVDIYFDIGDRNRIKFFFGAGFIDYSITFGVLKGFVKDEDGNEYCLDGMSGIGEDKTLWI